MRYEVQAFQNAPGRNGSIYYLLSWKININCERNFWITRLRLAGCWLEILRRAEEWSGQTMEIFVTPSQPSPAQPSQGLHLDPGKTSCWSNNCWAEAVHQPLGSAPGAEAALSIFCCHGNSKVTPTLASFLSVLAFLCPLLSYLAIIRNANSSKHMYCLPNFRDWNQPVLSVVHTAKAQGRFC